MPTQQDVPDWMSLATDAHMTIRQCQRAIEQIDDELYDQDDEDDDVIAALENMRGERVVALGSALRSAASEIRDVEARMLVARLLMEPGSEADAAFMACGLRAYWWEPQTPVADPDFLSDVERQYGSIDGATLPGLVMLALGGDRESALSRLEEIYREKFVAGGVSEHYLVGDADHMSPQRAAALVKLTEIETA